uniref:Uncharacterized protein n=1 Tax=viral metagenome TaxID=1070528 RepID=A0A6C0E4C0_9ZZZZ
MNHKELWNFIRIKKNTSKLLFIHTPKCSGTYTNKILYDLKIINKDLPSNRKNHIPANGDEKEITFTIIRNPVDRFESLLNFRLGIEIFEDWPKHLHYIYNNKNISLNEIVDKMSDDEILSFTPYKSLLYWTKNVDIIITIERLEEFLNFFGYFYDNNKYKKENVSVKSRGIFNNEVKNRISNLYYYDVLLYNKIKNSTFV